MRTASRRNARFFLFATASVVALSAPISAACAKDSPGAEVRELRDEVRVLKADMAAMQAQLAADRAQQAKTESVVERVQAQDAEVRSTVAAEKQREDLDIKEIPAQIASAVAAAKPKSDALYYKGVSIVLGGFVDATAIYRSRDLASDVSTPWNSIPFSASKTGHTGEMRFSARSSRVSALIQGKPNDATVLTLYSELDFQGAAQNANSNQSNGFNPRLRNMYGSVDLHDSGWHFLAGQTWSLATLNAKGITPRGEITPPSIDSGYLPGFVFTRQPQFRVTKDLFNKSLWFAVSVENPQTTFAGTVPTNVLDSIVDGNGFYAGASGGSAPPAAGGGTAVVPTTSTTSLNHLPDVVVKVAYELNLLGRDIHTEVFGLGRGFTDRIGTTNSNVYSSGVGGGVVIPAVPGLLDVQASFLTGKGIGRYGASQLPDVTFRNDGTIEPISETDVLAGLTLHATHTLDIYGFAGEEHDSRQAYRVGNTAWGYGSAQVNNTGCFTEGGTCTAATKLVGQLTGGLWQKVYQGPFGRAQFGMQYSYTERHAFSGIGGAPVGNEAVIMTSFRYFPF
jgi:hypothetical protein